MALTLMMVSLGSVAAQSAPSQAPVDPQDGCNYYEETGHNLCGIFLDYWEANGGLPVFGYPITEAFEEVSLDTGSTYLVQYFERERMEHHPALAGTEYEILLGRLGNEVLLKQGRNWQEFAKSNPGEENYIAATGFAVPQVFLDYWMSYGLDLGDPGISFRESLALFGYPISQAQMETNADGDTVLTQWFERARFEHHPDNGAGFEVLLGRLGVEVLAGDPVDPEPQQVLTTLAEGLQFPLHASTGGDGAVYVAEGGLGSENDECVVVEEDPESGEVFEICFGLNGSVTRVDDSGSERIVTGLPAISDVHVTAAGGMYAVTSLGGTPEMRDLFDDENAQAMGTLIQIHGDGDWTVIADLAQFEADVNPDPTMVDSNPYALTMVGENFLVVDAGGNNLLHVTPEGVITNLAVFEARMVLAPPFLGLPEGTEMPMESVPTDVEVGPDGNYYVSELTGFPFEVGAARVYQVTPAGDVTVFAEGFSAIGAIDFDSEGNLYVLEIATGGLLAAEMAGPDEPDAALSRVVKIAPNGTRTDYVTAGIYFATGLAVDGDDHVFIVNMSVTPMASVVRVDWVTPE